MSKVVQFLESLGREGDISADAYAAEVASLDLAPALRDALLSKDSSRLPQLLGAHQPVCFILAPAEGEPPAEGEQPAEPEPQQQPQARRLAAGC